MKAKSCLLWMALCISLLVLSACAAPGQPPAAQPPVGNNSSSYQGKKILWVDSYHQGYEWSDGIEAGIRSALEGSDVELKIFRMDTKRNPDPAFCQSAGQQAKQEIEAFQPDVVIATDDNAQKCLVVPYLKGSNLPVVFAGVNWSAEPYGYPASNVTGMIEVDLVEQAIALVQPYAKGTRVGYFAIDTETERKIAAIYNQRFFNQAMNEYWPASQQEFRELFIAAQDENDILLVINNSGASDWDEETMKRFMATQTRIPTISVNTWMAPYVLVDLAKFPDEQGEWAAQIALRILSGTPVSSIPLAENKRGRLFINASIADTLGIVFPPSVLKNAEIVK